MTLLIILYFLFASTFTISKAALNYTPPIFIVGVRFIIAGALLLFYQFFWNYKNWKISAIDWKDYLLMMLFPYYLTYITDSWALQYITSAKASLIYNLSPFITALLVYYMHRTTLTYKQIIGLLVGCLGFMPLLIQNNGFDNFFSISAAELVLISSVAFAAYGWLVLKKMVTVKNYSAIMANGIGALGGGVMALVHSFFQEGRPLIISKGQPQPEFLVNAMHYIVSPAYHDISMFIIYLILLIIISQIICYNLYGYLLTYYSATLVSFAGALTPLFGGILGWFFLKEQLTSSFWLSMLIVTIGLYIFYKDELIIRNKKAPIF